MKFSHKKDTPLTKKCQVRAFEVDLSDGKSLFDTIANNANFSEGKETNYNDIKKIKLKKLITNNSTHYLYFSVYHPKEQVPITPATGIDLLDIDNLDNFQAFLMIKGNRIAAILQISTNWPEVKISSLFKAFGLNIIPTVILNKSVISKIKNDGFRALHVNVCVSSADFVKQPGFIDSLLRNEPAISSQNITGHLRIDAKGNSTLANSIEKNTASWVNDLNSDFYLETKRDEIIKGDDVKLTQTYYTAPYGTKTIHSDNALAILTDFVSNNL